MDNELEKNKLLFKAEIIIASLALIILLSLLSISIYAINTLNLLAVPITLIILAFIIFILACTFCLYIEQKVGFYQCKICGHKHTPSFKQIFLAPHVNRTRYLKCPKCKKSSWNKKVLK